jgi:hypothetical protein
MYYDRKDHSQRIHHYMPLDFGELSRAATADFLARIVSAADPLFSVVFTDWLSMIAAEGVGSFPTETRTCSRSVSWTFGQVPSRRNRS